MSNLGPKWEDDEHYSPGRMNAKDITRDTGTNIVAIATTKQLGAVCPTDTSGGLIKNVLYICDYDSNFTRVGFIPVFGKHMHDADSNEAGGRLLDIRFANSGKLLEVNHYFVDDSLYLENNLNGTVTRISSTDDAYVEIKTLTATNNYANVTLSGPKVSFADKILLQFNAEVNLNSNILVRAGLNTDRVDEAQSTSRRQMGLEGCDGHGTNWVIINANGNTSSLTVTATTMPLNPGAEKNYKLFHTPATELRAYLDGVSNAVSTTNVASTGESTHLRLFRAGIKLPTGTTEKLMKLWHMQMIGLPATSQLT